MHIKTLLAAWLLIGGLAAMGLAQSDEDSDKDTTNREQQASGDESDQEAKSDGSERTTFAPSDDDRSSSRREDRDARQDERDDRRSECAENREDSQRDRRGANDRGDRSGAARTARLGITFDQTDDGLIVANVTTRGSAAKFGIRAGDQILTVNGERIDSEDEFERWTDDDRGGRVPVVVWRDGERRTIYWSGGDRLSRSDSRESGRRWRDNENRESQGDQKSAFLGVVFDTRYEDAAVVRQVYSNSPAQQAGVRAGDTILSVNGKQVSSGDDVSDKVADMEPGDHIDLLVSHAPPRMMEVRLGSRSEQHTAAYRGEREDLRDRGDESRDRESRRAADDSSERDSGGFFGGFGRRLGRD